MIPEVVINFHLTERCNYRCTFCFGHWRPADTTAELFDDVPRARRLVTDVASAVRRCFGPDQVIRATFAGGEPGLVRSLPELVTTCHALDVSTSFISNGLMLRRYPPEWIARNFDIVGLSIDSASQRTNLAIGRNTASGRTLDVGTTVDRVRRIRGHRRVTVKVNTVVCRANQDEDMTGVIRMIEPNRWKLFQVLPVYDHGEGIGLGDFHAFVDRHAEFAPIISVEDNDLMTGSYLMIDPLGRFFWRDESTERGYTYSDGILDVGADVALRQTPVDWAKYHRRYHDYPTETLPSP